MFIHVSEHMPTCSYEPDKKRYIRDNLKASFYYLDILPARLKFGHSEMQRDTYKRFSVQTATSQAQQCHL